MPKSGGPNAPFLVDNEVIRLTSNGVWISDEIEISHEPTRRLFAKSLRKDEQGYFLAVGRETKRIIVEDTAYFIHRIDGDPTQGLEIRLSDETREKLDPRTLKYRPGRLTCQIKGGTEEAKFLHAPYFDLLKEIFEQDGSYWIKVEGIAVRLITAGKQHRDLE